MADIFHYDYIEDVELKLEEESFEPLFKRTEGILSEDEAKQLKQLIQKFLAVNEQKFMPDTLHLKKVFTRHFWVDDSEVEFDFDKESLNDYTTSELEDELESRNGTNNFGESRLAYRLRCFRDGLTDEALTKEECDEILSLLGM